MPAIAIILPAFNEEATLGEVLRELVTSPMGLRSRVVVIDDGSTDRTSNIAATFPVTLINHRKNRGLGHTFRTAVEYCLAEHIDVMVFFDADGQFSVADIERVVAPVVSGSCDVALGSRFISGTPPQMPVMKRLGNHVLARFISWVTGENIHDVACGFRAYSREALLRLTTFSTFTYTQEVILDLLFKKRMLCEVPVTVHYSKGRRSVISSNLWRYGGRVFMILVRTIRDYKPLTFFGTVGTLAFVVGAILDIWMLWYYAATGGFSPYKIVGFGGAFLNFLGVTIWFIGLVADMLNRVRRTQEELLYVERKRLYGSSENSLSDTKRS